MFSTENFDDWKIRMQANLDVQDDDMRYVITDGPMKILKENTAVSITDGAPYRIEKPRDKIKMCKTGKEIWEKLIQMYEENEQTKENKLSVAVQKFDNIKMKAGEFMHDYDERISCIVNELNAFGKVYSNKEVALKVI
ncbi:uncharacterized protein [Primulina eburnea]|uniref:uncharacterized protein n=1 Tax=Primulina eburnea TaxID=1245227 RepID=UPI003C6CAA33